MNAFHTLTLALAAAALSAPALPALQLSQLESLDRLVGPDAGSRFGETFVQLSDLNQDGIPDLLIRLPSRDNRGLTAINGATGDLNQDGIADFLATGYRPNDSPQQWVEGVAKIFSGADGSLLRIHAGFNFEDFGRRAEAIGDVNGDGSPDIGLTATPLNRSWIVRPTIIIISGQNGQEIGRWQGPTHGGLVLTLGALGDTNQDGRDDFLVGVPQDWFAQSTYFGQTQVVTFVK